MPKLTDEQKAYDTRRTIDRVQRRIPKEGKGYSYEDAGMTKEQVKDRASAFDEVQNLREKDEEMYIERAVRAPSNRRP